MSFSSIEIFSTILWSLALPFYSVLEALSREMDITFASNEIIDEYLNVFKDYKLLSFLMNTFLENFLVREWICIKA